MSKKGTYIMGVALLLSVFFTISLVVLSGLSLSTAKNESERIERIADRRKEYYEACSKAELIEKELDEMLVRDNIISSCEIFGIDVNVVRTISDYEVSYVVPAGNNQQLSIELSCSLDAEPMFKVMRWVSEPSSEWIGNNDINLLQ